MERFPFLLGDRVGDGVEDAPLNGHNLNGNPLIIPGAAFLFVHKVPTVVGQRKNGAWNHRALGILHDVRSPAFSTG